MYLNKTSSRSIITLIILILSGSNLLGACQSTQIIAQPGVVEDLAETPFGLTDSEAATLASLEQIDEYPLYSMVYQGDYSQIGGGLDLKPVSHDKPAWACSLFAVFDDSENLLFGRNFDWDFSPGLLLFTDPPGRYASVSMVDLYYLGFGGDQAYGITELPLEDRVNLLDAPSIPFDGINEAGLMIGMAAVPEGGMGSDPEKETVDSVMVIRMILDQAATIKEAIDIIRSVNIDMQGNYLHYLIAEESGRSALIEFSGGKIAVHYNTEDWQPATNFLVSEAGENPNSQCWRYDLISSRLEEEGGRITVSQALDLLEDVAQENTQWSIVYRGAAGEVWIAMGGDFDQIYRYNFFD